MFFCFYLRIYVSAVEFLNGNVLMKIRLPFLCVFCILFLSHPLYAQPEREKVQEANELYKAEKYNEALNLYRIAALDNPESPGIHYNIGNTLFKQGSYEEAFQEYNKVLTAKDADLHFRSYYNMGNTLYRMGKLPEAILSYTEALKLDPGDDESKYNLEFVRNKLKEQLQNQEQNQQQQQEQQSREGQQEDQKQEEQEQQQQQQEEGQQEEQQQEEQQLRQEEKEMTPEEADRILNALQNDEKDLQKQRKMSSTSNVRVKKDW